MADTASAFTPPALLIEAHDFSNFNSGTDILDEWLKHRAVDNLKSAASRSYVICPAGTNEVIGFYALSMGQIFGHAVVGSMRRNMPPQIPSVILGRLAIDKTWQGRGLGRALLADAVRRSLRAATEVSARLIIVHAISPAAEAFYLHHGFTRLPTESPTLAFDLNKAQKF